MKLNANFVPQLAQIIDQRLGRAVHALSEIAREKVGQPYPPASEPGEPPHRRTGGLQRAIFAEKSGQMDWVFGVRAVEANPERPGEVMDNLGLWMELGTGSHRRITTQRDAAGNPPARFGMVKRPPEIVRTSVYPRPYLLPTLFNDGPRVIAFYLKD